MNSENTVVNTKRLSIAKACLDDAPFIFELLNTPSWIEYIGDRGIKTVQDAERYIQDALIDSYQKNGFGLYKVLNSEESKPIGLCGLLQREFLQVPDLGFAILPEYAGKGYMKEAAQAVLKYETNKHNLKEVQAITSPINSRSRGLLKVLGFSMLKAIWPDGNEEELVLYSYKHNK